MNGEISWTFGELEAVLAGIHDIDPTKRTAFQSRLKNFHRMGFPIGFKAIKGKAARYSPLQIVEMALALELTQLGLPPERTVSVLSINTWAVLSALRLACGLKLEKKKAFGPHGGGDGDFPMFLYFDPTALQPLSLGQSPARTPDLDGASTSFFFAGIGVLKDELANWTSGSTCRLSLINLSALLSEICLSPFAPNRGRESPYDSKFLRELDSEVAEATAEWEGGNDAEAAYVFQLLEASQEIDTAELARRTDIPERRVIAYAEEYMSQLSREDVHGNS